MADESGEAPLLADSWSWTGAVFALESLEGMERAHGCEQEAVGRVCIEGLPTHRQEQVQKYEGVKG